MFISKVNRSSVWRTVQRFQLTSLRSMAEPAVARRQGNCGFLGDVGISSRSEPGVSLNTITKLQKLQNYFELNSIVCRPLKILHIQKSFSSESMDVVVSARRRSEITDFVELLDISQTTAH